MKAGRLGCDALGILERGLIVMGSGEWLRSERREMILFLHYDFFIPGNTPRALASRRHATLPYLSFV